MNIQTQALTKLLREYDDKQLAAVREQRVRIRKIEEDIPELSGINSHIAQLSADMAVMRIKGDSEGYQKASSERDELIKYRDCLMNAAGITQDDLKPRYECSICKDTGYVDGRMCTCLRSRMIDILYDQSNIREILKRENFSTFTLKYYSSEPSPALGGLSPLNIAKNALACAMDFVRFFGQRNDNLFINGETGTGKTFLCNCIARAVLDAGFSVIYLSAVRLFDTLAKSMFSDDRREKQDDDLYSCDLLIIDDLGTEYSNSFTQVSFFNCINERLLRGRSTIISTNLPMERIRSDYSERVFSRIAEKYICIRLYGDDIRIIKKLEG